MRCRATFAIYLSSSCDYHKVRRQKGKTQQYRVNALQNRFPRHNKEPIKLPYINTNRKSDLTFMLYCKMNYTAIKSFCVI